LVEVPEQSTPERRGEEYGLAGVSPAPTAPKYVALVCPLCGTRMYAVEGTTEPTLTCPDCGTLVAVPPSARAPAIAERAEPGSPALSAAEEEYGVYQGAGQPPSDDRAVHQVYIPVVCPVCHTRMMATESQVGQDITCPDCRTPSRVPPPSPAARPERPSPAADIYEIRQSDLPAEPPAGEAPAPPAPDAETGTPRVPAAIEPAPPGGSTLPAPPETPSYPLVCGVCHTRLQVTPDRAKEVARIQWRGRIFTARLFVTPDQVGLEFLCPGCLSPLRISLPPGAPAEVQREPAEESSSSRRPPAPPRPPPVPPRPPPVQGDEVRPSEPARRPAEAHPAPSPRPPDPARRSLPTYPVICGVCHTRLHATPDQAGQEILCPDCLSPIHIPPPPEARAKPEVEKAEPYSVSAPPKRAAAPVLVPGYEPIVGDEPLRRSGTARGEEPEAIERPRGGPAGPDRGETSQRAPWPGFFRGAAAFPFRLSTLLTFIALSVLVLASLALLFLAPSDTSNPTAAVPYIMSVVFSVAVAVPTAVYGGSKMLWVVQITAAGAHDIGGDESLWIDRVVESLYIFLALLVSVAAAAMAVRILDLLGLGWEWPTIAVAGAAIFLVFPVGLLSSLENAFPLGLVSWPVLRSLASHWKSWVVFYFQGLVVLSISCLATLVSTRWLERWTLSLQAPLLVWGAIVYFRLLGRLAWSCSQAEPAVERKRLPPAVAEALGAPPELPGGPPEAPGREPELARREPPPPHAVETTPGLPPWLSRAALRSAYLFPFERDRRTVTTLLALMALLWMMFAGLGVLFFYWITIAALWGAFAGSQCAAIFVGSAAGRERPSRREDRWGDWDKEDLWMLLPLGVAFAAGLGIKRLLDDAGYASELAAPLVAVLLFPVLSIPLQEKGRFLRRVSAKALRSLLTHAEAWLSFYLQVALLAGAAGLSWWTAGKLIGTLSLLVLAPLAVWGLMVYSRLLGRLARCCAEEDLP
jgi:uncharacterized CHY-type Zn-finger protein